MDGILQWGLDLIISLQQTGGPILDDIFRAITFLGEQEFFLFLAPFLFWCVGLGLGVRATIGYLLSAFVVTGIKDILQEPRPFHLDPSVGRVEIGGYGMPSGHATSTAFVYSIIAHWAKKSWVWVTVAVLMLLVGFSRVYLGAHFPAQVLAGWFLAAILFAIYAALHLNLEAWLKSLSLIWQLALALGLPIILLLIHPAGDIVAAMAVLAGLGVGLTFLHRYVAFRPDGPWWQRIARFVVGMVVILALYLGLSAIFPAEGEPLYLIFRFLRYCLIGLWMTLGAPWLFGKLGLA